MSNARLTFAEFAGIQNGRYARIHFKMASLEVSGRGEDAHFVMQGPSGKHTLLVSATDFDRLNDHWVTFANHALNDFPEKGSEK